MIKWIQILLFLNLLIQINCSTDQISGTSSSENAKIIGTIVDELDVPVKTAKVRLRTRKNNHLSKDVDTTVYTTVRGEYTFSLPPVGLYFITIKKDNKRIAFIDSILIEEMQKVEVPLYKKSRTGIVMGVIKFIDTSDVTKNRIEISCDQLDFKKTYSHGDTFCIDEVPRGKYGLMFMPESDLFHKKRINFGVKPGELKNLDTIMILSQVYFSESELNRLIEKLAVSEKKDIKDTKRILKEEGNLYNKLWKHEQDAEVIRIIEDAVEKAKDAKNVKKEYYTNKELKEIARKLASDANKDYNDVIRILSNQKFFDKRWKKKQKDEVIKIIKKAVKKAIDS